MEEIYNFQKNLKQLGGPWFKLFGSGSKHIDDKEKWVKHSRHYLILMTGLIIALFLIVIFEI